MKKIQYAVYKRETGSAGGKAKNDAFDIVENLGFFPSYKPSDYMCVRILQQIISMTKFDKDTFLFVQYPAVGSHLLSLLKKKIQAVSYSVVLIHDLTSIQGMGGNIEQEIKFLSMFDCIISHNKRMEKFLREKGVCNRIINIEIFDYLHDLKRGVNDGSYTGDICVAGNLDKSIYLNEIYKVKKKFNLYGIKNNIDLSGISNASYKGLFSSDEIVYQLEGAYGLVWDGDSITKCGGIYGEYLKYNNPHKLSLYIAAGKPVITWEDAAIADFVKEKNIGITVNSLLQLNDLDLMKGYNDRKKNVLKLKEKIGSGEFLRKSIKEAQNEKRN